jgi:hypothetical protein
MTAAVTVSTNKAFLSAIFGNTDAEGHIAHTSFAISPQRANGEWKAKLAPLGKSPKLLKSMNNYFSTAVVRAERDMDNFIRLAVELRALPLRGTKGQVGRPKRSEVMTSSMRASFSVAWVRMIHSASACSWRQRCLKPTMGLA